MDVLQGMQFVSETLSVADKESFSRNENALKIMIAFYDEMTIMWSVCWYLNNHQ